MKKLACLLIIALLMGCFALVGCREAAPAAPSAPTAQQAADEEVARVSLADYEFDLVYMIEEDKADPAASYYYLCRTEDGETDGVVYGYRDLCYDESKSYRYFDAYSPAPLSQLDPDTPVLVYLHGGGWFFGNRHNDRELMAYFARAGFVVISMEYALLCGLNQLPNTYKGISRDEQGDLLSQLVDPETPVCISDMMDDVRTCLTALSATYLPEWGLNATKVGLCGYSAGGHLASLYAYKYNDAPLKAGFLLSLVGPVSLIDPGYLKVLDKLIDSVIYSALLPAVANTLAYAVGSEEPLDVTTEEGYAGLMAAIPQWQPVDYITSDSVPSILCYAGWDGTDNVYDEDFYTRDPLSFEAPSDTLVPVSVYDTYLAKLQECGVVHTAKLWQDHTHVSAGTSTETMRWMAERAKAYANLYLRNYEQTETR